MLIFSQDWKAGEVNDQKKSIKYELPIQFKVYQSTLEDEEDKEKLNELLDEVDCESIKLEYQVLEIVSYLAIVAGFVFGVQHYNDKQNSSKKKKWPL